MRRVLLLTLLAVGLPTAALADSIGFTNSGGTPSAPADTVVYDITSTSDGVHVTFDLPSFEEVVNNVTTFTVATSNSGPITNFSISGNSTDCSGNGASFPGPCWIAVIGNSGGLFDIFSPAFTGPGTFVGPDTTVTITEVSTVPEPSGLVLLSTTLPVAGLIIMRKRRLANRSIHFPSIS